MGYILFYQQLGWVCFVSIGAFIVVGPFISMVTSMEVKLQEQLMEHKDERTKLVI